MGESLYVIVAGKSSGVLGERFLPRRGGYQLVFGPQMFSRKDRTNLRWCPKVKRTPSSGHANDRGAPVDWICQK